MNESVRTCSVDLFQVELNFELRNSCKYAGFEVFMAMGVGIRPLSAVTMFILVDSSENTASYSRRW